MKASNGGGASNGTMTKSKPPGSASATAAAGWSVEDGGCEQAAFDTNFATEAFFTRARSSNKSSPPRCVYLDKPLEAFVVVFLERKEEEVWCGKFVEPCERDG